MISVKKYKSLSLPERILFLDVALNDSTSLSPEFCIEAFKWEKDPFPKWYLIKAIGILRITSVINLLIDTCKSPDVKVNQTSLHLITAWSLGKIGGGAVDIVLEEAKHKDVDRATLLCFVDALGEMRSSLAIELLVRCFRDSPFDIKSQTALSLSKIGRASLDVLHDLAKESNTWPERILALDAIQKIGHASSRAIIHKRLKEGVLEEKVFILQQCQECLDSTFKDLLQDLESGRIYKLSELAHNALISIEKQRIKYH